MPDASESAKIAFAPHFDVRTVDERRMLLLSEDRGVLLTGKLYVAIAPFLDGSRTRDEIVAALRSTTTAPLDRIELAMSTLLSKQYATPVAPGVPAPRAAFWTELAVDPASAEHAIRTTHVTVRSLGRVPGAKGLTSQFIATLAEAGFLLVADTAGADLTVVLVDDYLDPQLDAINREMRQAARRWLPFKATGRVAWLGPIFQPEGGPCWACLAKRIGENRPGELHTTDGEPVPRFPRSAFSAGVRDRAQSGGARAGASRRRCRRRSAGGKHHADLRPQEPRPHPPPRISPTRLRRVRCPGRDARRAPSPTPPVPSQRPGRRRRITRVRAGRGARTSRAPRQPPHRPDRRPGQSGLRPTDCRSTGRARSFPSPSARARTVSSVGRMAPRARARPRSRPRSVAWPRRWSATARGGRAGSHGAAPRWPSWASMPSIPTTS